MRKSQQDFFTLPGFTQGDVTTLASWSAVLPDPNTPGKNRVVDFIIEMRMQLQPDDVDIKGQPLKAENDPQN